MFIFEQALAGAGWGVRYRFSDISSENTRIFHIGAEKVWASFELIWDPTDSVVIVSGASFLGGPGVREADQTELPLLRQHLTNEARVPQATVNELSDSVPEWAMPTANVLEQAGQPLSYWVTIERTSYRGSIQISPVEPVKLPVRYLSVYDEAAEAPMYLEPISILDEHSDRMALVYWWPSESGSTTVVTADGHRLIPQLNLVASGESSEPGTVMPDLAGIAVASHERNELLLDRYQYRSRTALMVLFHGVVGALALIPCDIDYECNLAIAGSVIGVGAIRVGIRQATTFQERRDRRERLSELALVIGLSP